MSFCIIGFASRRAFRGGERLHIWVLQDGTLDVRDTPGGEVQYSLLMTNTLYISKMKIPI